VESFNPCLLLTLRPPRFETAEALLDFFFIAKGGKSSEDISIKTDVYAIGRKEFGSSSVPVPSK
jgi:hypothetical protein